MSIGQNVQWIPRNPLLKAVAGEILALSDSSVSLLAELPGRDGKYRVVTRSLATGKLVAV